MTKTIKSRANEIIRGDVFVTKTIKSRANEIIRDDEFAGKIDIETAGTFNNRHQGIGVGPARRADFGAALDGGEQTPEFRRFFFNPA